MALVATQINKENVLPVEQRKCCPKYLKESKEESSSDEEPPPRPPRKRLKKKKRLKIQSKKEEKREEKKGFAEGGKYCPGMAWDAKLTKSKKEAFV